MTESTALDGALHADEEETNDVPDLDPTVKTWSLVFNIDISGEIEISAEDLPNWRYLVIEAMQEQVYDEIGDRQWNDEELAWNIPGLRPAEVRPRRERPTFTEVIEDEALAAYVAAGVPVEFRVVEDHWDWNDDNSGVRTIKKVEKLRRLDGVTLEGEDGRAQAQRTSAENAARMDQLAAEDAGARS